MTSKVCSLEEAVASIPDGAAIGIGGGPMSRRPMSLVREVIRQGRKGLTLVTYTGGIDVDALLAAGAASIVRAPYVGFEYLGLAPHYQPTGNLTIVVETIASLASGLRAGAGGLPFLPARPSTASDVLEVRTDVRRVTCPYTGATLVAWPAITVDVALLHVADSDPFGCATLGDSVSMDEVLADAAERVIISAESIGSKPSSPRSLEGSSVSHVVHARHGAHPTAFPPLYDADVPELLGYLDLARKPPSTHWLADWAGPSESEYGKRFNTPEGGVGP
ncbi:hypothetical protein CFI00_17205 [Nocardioides sp. S5]|uniref:CoA transferase subunit A n=1 Tax=Nocardioides sp. S5 TaxID=2017486 RepID=UPI001A8E03E3|nr:CoA-transferase [Nocardioides sp. S5]QSR32201.1 hypothetical protein CFI00_17205 [Nocardioides sp. S5]